MIISRGAYGLRGLVYHSLLRSPNPTQKHLLKLRIPNIWSRKINITHACNNALFPISSVSMKSKLIKVINYSIWCSNSNVQIITTFIIPGKLTSNDALVVQVNPLSPNIHIQILQTDLHTFPLRMSWENLIKDQGIFTWVIILIILITYLLTMYGYC